MYNRYIRGDNGSYTRVPQEENHSPRTEPKPPPSRRDSPPQQEPPPRREQPPPPPNSGGNSRMTDGLTGFLRHFLDQLHLDHVDTGDLLLLGLLFFLFREDADEELLVALGLLLIL